MQGHIGEEMFDDLISLFPKTFKKVKTGKSKQELVQLATAGVPMRVQTALKTTGNCARSLVFKEEAWLLDHLFGVDCLIAVNLGKGNVKLVAVDVTTNPRSVLQKEQKMHNSRHLLKSIGVQVGLIAFWDVNTYEVIQNPTYLKKWGLEILKAIQAIDDRSFAGTVILSL